MSAKCSRCGMRIFVEGQRYGTQLPGGDWVCDDGCELGLSLREDGGSWRLTATINRLIANILAACKMLREEGHISLAGQLERDRDNLVYYQEHGGLMFKGDEGSDV